MMSRDRERRFRLALVVSSVFFLFWLFVMVLCFSAKVVGINRDDIESAMKNTRNDDAMYCSLAENECLINYDGR